MRRSYASIILLFLAFTTHSLAQTEEGERTVTVRAGAAAAAECPLGPADAARWRRLGAAGAAGAAGAGGGAGGELPAGLRPGLERERGGRVWARLETAAAAPHHAGRYECGPRAGQRLRLVVLPPASEAASQAAAEAAGAAEGEGPVQYYDLNSQLAVNCSLPNPDNLPITWEKNGTSLELMPELQARAVLSAGGARLALRDRAREDDWGAYTCRAGAAAATVRLHARPHLRLPSDAAVVEGQTLRLACRVTGLPRPELLWLTVGEDDKTRPALEVLGARAAVSANEQGVEGAVLSVNATAAGDAGRYACLPLGDAERNATVTVRVKDKYAAVWPFLGICAEVVVLCAAILLYERRRTKPDLDDSDTDHHDQKKS